MAMVQPPSTKYRVWGIPHRYAVLHSHHPVPAADGDFDLIPQR